MQYVSTFIKNASRIPSALPRIVSNISKLKQRHQILEKRRDQLAPLAIHTYANLKNHHTFHPAQGWIDKDLPMSRKEYNEYVWHLRDMHALLPLSAPIVFGSTIGTAVIAGWLSQKGYLPSAFSESTDIDELKYQWYVDHADDVRCRVGPMLRWKIKSYWAVSGAEQEHIWIHESCIESFRHAFYSHYYGQKQDVRKVLNLQALNDRWRWVLLTNRDPIEETLALRQTFADIEAMNISAAEKTQKKNEAARAELKAQEAAGFPGLNDYITTYVTRDNQVLSTDGQETIPCEDQAPLEEMELTGDRVYVPHEHRTGMEQWPKELARDALKFLLLPRRFSPASWDQRRISTWYEQIRQDDSLIERGGGVQKLTDLQLKVALLDRAVLRLDEDLTRGDMEARYKEVSFLMSKCVCPSVLMTWQTSYYMGTYSPEDDLPVASLLPKYNRTPIDVDTHNPKMFEDVNAPEAYLHPALYPDVHKKLV
eukprot:NODE_1371_length_1533_cov_175.108108_g1298_i0.p1 GENE.NODE_1371_length_1533_cov_175.108108_g1298_i0~~NODE_1371_length_1533_cov_175.108108_g1298_i0.p1  ORF type:complete len:481 (-),score=80.42 NODE_1371_length_1533_cov_175.108108_g1298_i0:38-1480(-)